MNSLFQVVKVSFEEMLSQRARILLVMLAAATVPILIYNEQYYWALVLSTLFALMEVVNGSMLLGWVELK
jgi:hypothetical protein